MSCVVIIPMAVSSKLTTKPDNLSHRKSCTKLYSGVVSTTNPSTRSRAVLCSASSELIVDERERRSGNYSPSVWNVDYIHSLHSDYKEEKHGRRARELIMQVKAVLEKERDLVRQLELIDDLQRLGLSDHFENEFKEILNNIDNGQIMREESGDLYSTALQFRLLRQHNFQVTDQEVFECFKNEEGEFKASLIDDTRGLLQLFEASFLLTEGEKTLELAREFAAEFLQKKLINQEISDDNLLSSITYSLDVPIHWRVKRQNASLWIDAYRKRSDMNPIVLELALLDSNIVQAQYQDELKQALQWWRNTCIKEKLPFVRDRLVECYFWATGIVEPRQHGDARITVCKANAFVTTIDDIYDVYGTLEELEQFTEFFRRWDISSIDQLPSYMQVCFLALDNFINDTAYDVLKEQGFNIIPYLRKTWRDLVETYLIEAKWYYSGYKPTLEEYLNNGWFSVGATILVTHAFFRVTNPLTKEAADALYEYHVLLRWASIISRFADDLGTSVDEVSRGDVPKAIQCYMNENNASEEEAREHAKWMIAETWKKLNEESWVSKDSPSPFCKDFIGCAVDMARMVQYMYHYGDGHGIQHPKIHQQMTDCLFQPM